MARLSPRAVVSIGGFAALLVWVPVAQGQGARTPSIGLTVGVADNPNGLQTGCYSRSLRGAMTNLGAFVSIPAGRLAIEGRAGGHFTEGSPVCATALMLPEVGTHTERVSSLSSGSFSAVDLRVRWRPARTDALDLAMGGGWAGSMKDVPYLTAGVGGRVPAGQGRLGIDLELTAYRVPWIERTIEVTDDATTETVLGRFTEWAPSLGVRLSAEIPMRWERASN
jgi:hypothetical protein